MSQALSTRAVGAPQGTTGQYSRQPTAKVVPLSVFFLNMQGEGGDEEDNGLYGRRKRKPKKKRSKSDRGQRTGDKTVGGDADAAQAASGDSEPGQSTASESATMSGGTPLVAPGGATKFGATRATVGSMGSGNVAKYPIPIGGVLRRNSPLGDPKKKKKSKKDRSRWMQRMMTV